MSSLKRCLKSIIQENRYLRVDVLQLLQQSFIFFADQFLVSEEHVPNGVKVTILFSKILVLTHVVLDEVHQGGGIQLREPRFVNLLGSGWCGYK